MDQNYQPYQPEQFNEPQLPAKKNASYFRAKARAALKHCYGYAILAFLLASLLGGVASSGGASFSFGNTTGSTENYDIPVEQAEQFLETKSFAEAWDVFMEMLPTEVRTVLVVVGIVVAVALVAAIAFSIFVGSPVKLGYQRYCLNVMDGKGKDISVLFRYFKQGYGKSIGLNILYSLLMFAISLPMLAVIFAVVFPAFFKFVLESGNSPTNESIIALILSMLLLFAVAIATSIVQIIVQYRYAYCFMILAEYPEMRVVDAFRNSASLMKGKKFRLFCLQFSFIGWILLAACCTCGIGMIFLTPYMNTANAAFYDDITNRAAAREAEFPSLDPDDYIVE